MINTKTVPEPDKTIGELWLDLKVCSQFALLWDRAEENVALIMKRELAGFLPDDDDARFANTVASSGRSPAYWMSQTDGPPAWFRRDHCGDHGGANYWSTQNTLIDTNRKRAAEHLRILERLAKAREVLSRTVRG